MLFLPKVEGIAYLEDEGDTPRVFKSSRILREPAEEDGLNIAKRESDSAAGGWGNVATYCGVDGCEQGTVKGIQRSFLLVISVQTMGPGAVSIGKFEASILGFFGHNGQTQ